MDNHQMVVNNRVIRRPVKAEASAHNSKDLTMVGEMETRMELAARRQVRAGRTHCHQMLVRVDHRRPDQCNLSRSRPRRMKVQTTMV